jgi:hypothetical protein
MSDVFRIQSVCECQAVLEADLDEHHQVLRGWAHPRGEQPEPAPANSIGAEGEADRFDVAWQCPICGRDTLRSFHVGALRRLSA